mmetsp:Transcript_83496/g.221518  ORF Transcript_83496/g.221518 Transcript_83496/m.221518 type:complete len:297 (+) Transcript_83496:765-1655(+)
MTFFVLSDCLDWNVCSFPSSSIIICLFTPSRLFSAMNAAHVCTQKFSRPWSVSRALRMRLLFTPASCFSLYSKSFFSASAISFSYFMRMAFSPWPESTMPFQVLKTVLRRDLSLPWAKPMSAFLDFAFCSAPNVCSCVSTARSCCCACSAYSADLVRRSSRFSMLRNQVSWHLCNDATSLLACTTACFKICWPIEVESTSSMVPWMFSGTPSSMVFRTRADVVTSICSCKARCSKSSRMAGGSLSTIMESIALSSMLTMDLMSDSDRSTPLIAKISSPYFSACVADTFWPREFMTR